MKVIEYGFVDIHGCAWSNGTVDCYNRLSAEIEKRESEGFATDRLKDDRHHVYMSGLYAKLLEEKNA